MRARTLLTLAAGLLLGGTAYGQTTLRIGLAEDPDVLDPHRARTYVGRIVFASLCDKLIDITPELGFVPSLATEWSWSDDNLVLTFTLRDGITFQDGEPIDAAAVKANLDRARTLPDSLRKSELASVAEVTAVDPKTVAVRLSQPDASLLAQFSDRAGMMLAPKAFAAGDFGQNPVCSGPYRFVERVQNDRIVLEKDPSYWDAASYNIDRVVFQPIPDTTVRLANLQAGDLDMLERPAPSDVPVVQADADIVLVSGSGLGYQSIEINVNNGDRAKTPLGQDKRVRQALELAVDRNAINEVVGAGTFPPAQQPFPEASPYKSEKFPVRARDVEKAKQLLKAAGHEHLSFELVFGTGTTAQQTAELIQAMATEAGFDIRLRATEFAAMQQEMQQGNFDAAQIGWSGRVDPDGNIHAAITCEGNLNDGRYCNPDVDRLLDAARLTPDPVRRKDLYDQAQAILQDELPIIYTYYEPRIFVLSKTVKSFVSYPDGLIRLKGMSVEG